MRLLLCATILATKKSRFVIFRIGLQYTQRWAQYFMHGSRLCYVTFTQHGYVKQCFVTQRRLSLVGVRWSDSEQQKPIMPVACNRASGSNTSNCSTDYKGNTTRPVYCKSWPGGGPIGMIYGPIWSYWYGPIWFFAYVFLPSWPQSACSVFPAFSAWS